MAGTYLPTPPPSPRAMREPWRKQLPALLWPVARKLQGTFPSAWNAWMLPGLCFLVDFQMLGHVAVVVFLVWLSGYFGVSIFLALTWSLLYLGFIDRSQRDASTSRLRHEAYREVERQKAFDVTETCGWVNTMTEALWNYNLEPLICENILKVVPWFLDTFKPGALEKLSLLKIRLGSTPPVLSNMRVYSQPSSDDHIVLECSMSFFTDADFSATAEAKVRTIKVTAQAFITSLRMEGKVRVGIQLAHNLPLIKRVRVSFVTPPKVGVSVKPLTTHSFDIAHMPIIANLIEHTLTSAVESTVVTPNILTIDVPKLLCWDGVVGVPAQLPNWIELEHGRPEAIVLFEILEGRNLRAADRSGKSDPYVKLHYFKYQRQTNVKKKTLNPLWNEEFQLYVPTWASPQVALIKVLDHDDFSRDDKLGQVQVDLAKHRHGARTEMWLPLEDAPGKKGQAQGEIRIAITLNDMPYDDNRPAGLNKEALGVGPVMSSEMQAVAATSQEPIPQSLDLDVGIGQPGAMSIYGPAASQLLDQQNARAAEAMDATLPGTTVASVNAAYPDADVGLRQEHEFGTSKSLVTGTGEDGLPEYSTDRVVGHEPALGELSAEESAYTEGAHKHRIKQGLKKLINKATGA
ncbi:hypothetical protein KFL_000020160 [Klebsormidium nitens]|uniref:C2 domain-containing protein n=1 Tax=Klebsormidium nitens TaxID=105231 RepID=A0A1Y1HGV0_KLENI|nr:hypothetical protein KFL_000020160 [Klebsormidium nitens]|eukprot:GAQ77655.1 hypothetical protein KFL_000020160 [Klebsormidium nitens]